MSNGETLAQLLPEAFAVCREASRRVMNMRHFDVQLIGGMVLNDGKMLRCGQVRGKPWWLPYPPISMPWPDKVCMS